MRVVVIQTVRKDVWDYDLGSQGSLVDFPAANGTVPALILPSKQGDIYILDRRTGQRIVRSDAFVPHENTFARPTAQGVRIAPGIQGGSNWQPMSYSPDALEAMPMLGPSTPGAVDPVRARARICGSSSGPERS